MEAAAFHQFHGDVKRAVFFARVIHHNNIRVSQNTGGAGLSLKSRKEFRTIGAFAIRGKMHGFNRDVAPDYGIVRAINYAHSAAAQLIEKLVAPGFGKCRHRDDLVASRAHLKKDSGRELAVVPAKAGGILARFLGARRLARDRATPSRRKKEHSPINGAESRRYTSIKISDGDGVRQSNRSTGCSVTSTPSVVLNACVIACARRGLSHKSLISNEL